MFLVMCFKCIESRPWKACFISKMNSMLIFLLSKFLRTWLGMSSAALSSLLPSLLQHWTIWLKIRWGNFFIRCENDDDDMAGHSKLLTSSWSVRLRELAHRAPIGWGNVHDRQSMLLPHFHPVKRGVSTNPTHLRADLLTSYCTYSQNNPHSITRHTEESAHIILDCPSFQEQRLQCFWKY